MPPDPPRLGRLHRYNFSPACVHLQATYTNMKREDSQMLMYDLWQTSP